LLKKVKTPGYDPDHDTSLTDGEIALLNAWKAAKEGANGKKRKKKAPPGVYEDLSDMPPPNMDPAVQSDPGEIDMKRLLFPKAKIPTGAKNFLTYYSPGVLDGWVNQTSPACAEPGLNQFLHSRMLLGFPPLLWGYDWPRMRPIACLSGVHCL
jgi:hypothetical protein